MFANLLLFCVKFSFLFVSLRVNTISAKRTNKLCRKCVMVIVEPAKWKKGTMPREVLNTTDDYQFIKHYIILG